jgi:hypothetical protein
VNDPSATFGLANYAAVNLNLPPFFQTLIAHQIEGIYFVRFKRHTGEAPTLLRLSLSQKLRLTHRFDSSDKRHVADKLR